MREYRIPDRLLHRHARDHDADLGKDIGVLLGGQPGKLLSGHQTPPARRSMPTARFYSRVVEFERGGTKVVPGLAERWIFSPDGKTYTFHLRHGVKWHSNRIFKPTRDFGADDVVFSFERQWKENHPFFKVTSSNHSYFNDMGLPALLKSVEKLDDHTVRVALNEPEAPFLSDLAMDFAAIQSKEYADAMGKAGTPEKIDQEPIGTGPYFLLQYQKDAVIRYRAFADYWDGKAKIDDLVFLDNAGRGGALGQAAEGRMSCHALSKSGRYRTPCAGPRALRCWTSRGSTSAISPTTRPRSRSMMSVSARR